MVDMYRFPEDEEKKVVATAMQLDPAVRDIMQKYHMQSLNLGELLERLSVKKEDVEDIKDIVDFDTLENVPPGDEQYRDFHRMENLAAATVMLAEAIVIAKDAGKYNFRFIDGTERRNAQMAVEGLAPYKGLFNNMQGTQMKVLGELEKMRGNPTADAVMARIRKMGISQEPIAVFELPATRLDDDTTRRRKDRAKHYLCMMKDSRSGTLRASHMSLFSMQDALPLRESYYFNPGVHQEDHYEVRKHFEC